MLTLVVILAAACIYVEYKLTQGAKPLLRVLSWSRLISLAFSLALSVFLGGLFGAAGLIVFAAGVVSTVLIQPYYHWAKSGKWDEWMAKYEAFKKTLSDNKALYLHRAHQTWVVLRLSFLVVTWPFRMFLRLWDVVADVAEKLSPTKP